MDLVHGFLGFAAGAWADEVGDGDGAVVQQVGGEVVHAAGGFAEEVRGDHGVEGDAAHVDSGVAEDEQVVLDVVAALGEVGVFEDGSEGVDDGLGVEVFVGFRRSDGDVGGVFGL